MLKSLIAKLKSTSYLCLIITLLLLEEIMLKHSGLGYSVIMPKATMTFIAKR